MPKAYHPLKYIPSDGTHCRRSSGLLASRPTSVNEELFDLVEQPKNDLERASHSACSRYRPGAISILLTITNLIMFFSYLYFFHQSLHLGNQASQTNAAVGLESVFPVLNPDAPNELDKQLYHLSPPNGALDTAWRHKFEQLNRIPISKAEIRKVDNKVAGAAASANREEFPITESAMEQLECLNFLLHQTYRNYYLGLDESWGSDRELYPPRFEDRVDYCTQLTKRNLLCHSLSSHDERRSTESRDAKVAQRNKKLGRSGRQRFNKQALMKEEEYRPEKSREEVCSAIGR
ncbi:MAG: hypothetical protein LQ351_005348 [Letrouitia transgressa]|nr:MAG: hypothetical protein LQ351_005348 [Letrouitia transgressa]